MNSFKRSDGRAYNQLRTLKLSYGFGYAAGSVLFHIGNTKVLCSVTMQPSVPSFLKGKKTGWLTAEYAMLPTATKQRTQRPSSALKQQGRSVEISRIISRSLRTLVDLDSLGERSIMVDCDVLQADGGTRAAAITGAYIALQAAQQRWLISGTIEQPFLTDSVAAVSVGIMKGQPLLDLNFIEDSAVDGDFNFILTKSGDIIEIQGSAERVALSWNEFDSFKKLAVDGVEQLFAFIEGQMAQKQQQTAAKAPLFSLQNRLQSRL